MSAVHTRHRISVDGTSVDATEPGHFPLATPGGPEL